MSAPGINFKESMRKKKKKIQATIRKAHGSDVKTQNIRHLDLIPFEKLLYTVVVKCWSPI